MEDTNETCPVCFLEIKQYGFCVTNCSHTFCMDCMVKCIKTCNDSCPLCRKELCSTPVVSIINNEERQTIYNEGWNEGHEIGYEQANIEFEDQIQEVTTRVYNQGYHAGVEVSSEITRFWKSKYNGLNKIYKGTVHQLQRTNTLSKPYKERVKLSRSTSL